MTQIKQISMNFGNYNPGLGQTVGPNTVIGGSSKSVNEELTFGNFNPGLGTLEAPKSTMSKTAAFSLGAIVLAALAFFGYKTVSEKQAKDGKSLTTRVTDGAMNAAASVKSAAQATKRFVQNKDNAFVVRSGLAVAAAGIGFLGYKMLPKKPMEYGANDKAQHQIIPEGAHQGCSGDVDDFSDLNGGSVPDARSLTIDGETQWSWNSKAESNNTAELANEFANRSIWGTETTPSNPESAMTNGKMPSKVSTRGAWQQAAAKANLGLSSNAQETLNSLESGRRALEAEQASIDSGFMSGILKMFGRNDVMNHLESNHEPVSVDERDSSLKVPSDEDLPEVGMDFPPEPYLG